MLDALIENGNADYLLEQYGFVPVDVDIEKIKKRLAELERLVDCLSREIAQLKQDIS